MAETNRIVDAQARLAALDPTRSFIVQAPAGSGKTELLTQRYLTLLATVDAPEEIVAITFTRKAASEMRNRILAALDKATNEPRPDKEHEQKTWDLARAALAHDAAHGWNLMGSPGRLRIQTIDSLSASLTRQMPLLSRLGSQPGLVEDASELYALAAQETLRLLETKTRWTQAVERLLVHLDNDFNVVERLLAGMLARRDQWLRHLADRDNERLRRATLEEALANIARDALRAVTRAIPQDAKAELVTLAAYGAKNLEEEGVDSAICVCLGIAALPGTEPDDVPVWRGLAELLLTKEGEFRKAINKRQGFPAGKDKQENERCKAMKERLAQLIAQFDGLLPALADIPRIPPARYDDAQWEVIEALYEVLLLAVAQLHLVFQERGEVDFIEIAQRALRALGKPEEPTDLALSLDYRIRHLLVDEFQDTSMSQYELLSLLTTGWQAGDSRTLFVVGDPMQSIYRFRQADVGLYLRARNEGIGQVRLDPLTLSVNFRSQQGIVDWVNQTFSQVLPRTENITAGAVSYAASVAFHEALPEAAVIVHPFFDKDGKSEAERVVTLVQAARAQAPEGTVAILVQGRRHLREIVPQLKDASLRFRAVEIEPLEERPIVQDLLALTNALMHPADRIAWLAILRAPWCGLTLADLEILVGHDQNSPVWNLITYTERHKQLSEEGAKRLQHFIDVFAQVQSARARGTLRARVEGAWLALGGPACARSATDLEDAHLFLEQLAELERAGEVDAATLSAGMQKLFGQPDVVADPRLQIMTIHKAKGLEFDTVIVPGLGRPPRGDDPQLLLWAERARSHGRNDLVLAPIREAGQQQHDAVYTFLADIHKQKGQYEEGRLLYVAATRAKNYLHLLGHAAVKEKDDERSVTPHGRSLLSRLWPAVAEHFERAAQQHLLPAEAETEQEIPVAPIPILRRLTLDWSPPAPPPAVNWSATEARPAVAAATVEFQWASETIRHVGTVVHAMLQQIAQQGLAQWDAKRISAMDKAIHRSLTQQGVPERMAANAVTRVSQALTQTLQDQRGRWILENHNDARNEYALSGMIDGRIVNIIMDRTFVDETGTRWIIDYKTSAHEGGGLEEFLEREQERYRAQLERYRELLSRMDLRPIRLGLYFPLLGAWRERG